VVFVFYALGFDTFLSNVVSCSSLVFALLFFNLEQSLAFVSRFPQEYGMSDWFWLALYGIRVSQLIKALENTFQMRLIICPLCFTSIISSVVFFFSTHGSNFQHFLYRSS